MAVSNRRDDTCKEMSPARSSRPPTHTLFLALWPDDTVRCRIREHADRWVFPSGSVRYGPPDWHVTLHFLGRVPAERVPDLAVNIDVPREPFELVLDRPTIWPRGLAVVSASTTPRALKSLHARLGEALLGMEQAVETRPYRPHLTLARRAEAAVMPDPPVPVVWPVSGFVLVVSTGRPDHRYEVLREYR